MTGMRRGSPRAAVHRARSAPRPVLSAGPCTVHQAFIRARPGEPGRIIGARCTGLANRGGPDDPEGARPGGAGGVSVLCLILSRAGGTRRRGTARPARRSPGRATRGRRGTAAPRSRGRVDARLERATGPRERGRRSATTVPRRELHRTGVDQRLGLLDQGRDLQHRQGELSAGPGSHVRAATVLTPAPLIPSPRTDWRGPGASSALRRVRVAGPNGRVRVPNVDPGPDPVVARSDLDRAVQLGELGPGPVLGQEPSRHGPAGRDAARPGRTPAGPVGPPLMTRSIMRRPSPVRPAPGPDRRRPPPAAPGRLVDRRSRVPRRGGGPRLVRRRP